MTDHTQYISVQSRGLIALPASVRRKLGLDRPGAQVEVIERQGEIILRPYLPIPADQAWFWTERWQRMEREADEAVAAGRVTVVDGVEAMLADLDT